MSKEIQCKCCKEYWWENNIHSKSGLCPNCYDYVTNLEAKLAESEKEIEYQESMKILAVKNQNQTAIAELEKVKKLLVEKMKLASDKLDCAYYIDQQINELKGE